MEGGAYIKNTLYPVSNIYKGTYIQVGIINDRNSFSFGIQMGLQILAGWEGGRGRRRERGGLVERF